MGNDRAIYFYKKYGYEKRYDIFYYSLDDLLKLNNHKESHIEIKEISIIEGEALICKAQDVHINWQNDTDYMKKSGSIICYGAYYEKALVGIICAYASGRISFLWVDRGFRGMQIASVLLKTVCKEMKLLKLSMGFPNNSLLEGFIKHIGFKKDSIAQYEMYLTY